MLQPLNSLAVRQLKSTEYIKNAVVDEYDELSFTNQNGNGRFCHIINIKIIQFLNRKLFRQNFVISLNLSNCHLNDQAIVLLSKGNWKSLQNLTLFSNQLTSNSFYPLSRGSWKNLQEINLSQNKFQNEKGEQLASCNWEHLTHLYLSFNNINLNFIQKLTNNSWKRLRSINLRNNQLSNSCLTHLVSFDWCSIEEINFENNHFTNDGMKVLVKGRWKNLKVLILNNNFIGLEGLQHLTSNNWSNTLLIEAIYDKDFHSNIVPHAIMKVQNLSKCKEMFKFKQKKIDLIIGRHYPLVNFDQQTEKILRLRNIDFVT